MIGAALLTKSFVRLTDVKTSFDPSHTLDHGSLVADVAAIEIRK